MRLAGSLPSSSARASLKSSRSSRTTIIGIPFSRSFGRTAEAVSFITALRCSGFGFRMTWKRPFGSKGMPAAGEFSCAGIAWFGGSSAISSATSCGCETLKRSRSATTSKPRGTSSIKSSLEHGAAQGSAFRVHRREGGGPPKLRIFPTIARLPQPMRCRRERASPPPSGGCDLVRAAKTGVRSQRRGRIHLYGRAAASDPRCAAPDRAGRPGDRDHRPVDARGETRASTSASRRRQTVLSRSGQAARKALVLDRGAGSSLSFLLGRAPARSAAWSTTSNRGRRCPPSARIAGVATA